MATTPPSAASAREREKFLQRDIVYRHTLQHNFKIVQTLSDWNAVRFSLCLLVPVRNMPMLSSLSARCTSFMGANPIIKPVAAKPCVSVCAARLSKLQVEAKRVCSVTGAKRNKANKVCFSNKKSRTFQQVNLQVRISAPRRQVVHCAVQLPPGTRSHEHVTCRTWYICQGCIRLSVPHTEHVLFL